MGRKSPEGFGMSFFLASMLVFILVASAATDNITPSQSVRDGETLVSSGGTFELGFFSPGNSTKRYLGLWYKVSPKTVVWVANREAPLLDHFGVLNVTKEGNIILVDRKNEIIWSSSKITAENPVVQLLDSGNLVVKEGNDTGSANFLWQSFDYPCDTLLSGMKLGKNFITGMNWSLSSWKSPNDPARGQFSALIDPEGFPQLVVRNGSITLYRGGSWNGERFTGTPILKQMESFNIFEFELNKNEVYYKAEPYTPTLLSRLVVNQSGFLERFMITKQSQSQSQSRPNIYFAPSDECDYYAVCGAYASCNTNNSPLCVCLDGFEPKKPTEWKISKGSGGCIRKTKLDCRNSVFTKYNGLKLPDTSNSSVHKSMSLKECQDVCSEDCSCMAYANSDVRNGGSGCLLWFGELIDMRVYTDSGQDLYIRMTNSTLAHPVASRNLSKKKKLAIILVPMILIGLIFGGLIFYLRWKKLTKQEQSSKYKTEVGKDDMELTVFDLNTIVKATANFSNDNKLGQGGFGPVYKGTLPEGQEIAVKRLSKSSRQGLEEFKNEVGLIAKLQHRNLVKLLGCSIQGDEKMLIYEYLPNKSLDYFIFDQTKSKLLDWTRRMHIIDGIARGLLYLHQDSRLRIIHRDLKASNVLLDNDLCPKISDFGMARTIWGDQTEANTNKVVGTYGYMPPEYAVDGLFSLKSDVFSFGVLVLEIISGKKNRGFFHPEHSHNLVGHAWKLWMEERPLQLIDSNLGDCFVVSEVLRCIHVGLLCVQKRPEDRPNMSSVVLTLGSENPLRQPKQPGFFTERNLPEMESYSSSSHHESPSVNEVTISILQAR